MVAPRLSHEWIQSGAVILTCHWHHARFDLRSGPTFDLWADDVPLRAVRIVDGEVWVAPAPAVRNEAAPLAPPPPRRACPQHQPGDWQGGAGIYRGRRAVNDAIHSKIVSKLRGVIEFAGIEFIEKNGGGEGVRLRAPDGPVP